ncbi:hypothetical protein LTR56_004203 [Elasticomyces elasticus]|nr:hypothetical protein LTR56_004203 [Elasticomyces elasticus]KAK3655092.1 hypothetical protein LTR22_010402 [Elasticomyces elasticus]KAK4910887.1 hypothetical protein LTR49_020499 [Elasticomyces elasticus]KAK5750306.1 hypothetical protein LTS12_019645 [Elasticomyces elasticus]
MFNNLTIEAAREDDIERILDILLASFGHMPVEVAVGNVDTVEGRRATGERHKRAWRKHAEQTDIPCAIKCVHTHPITRQQTIVGFCEWFIYDNLATPDAHEGADAVISADWVPDEGGQREKAQAFFRPTLEARKRWLHGRRCAVLLYMGVDPAWRRRGAATLCVQWGADKCRGLGIIAYLEATEEGQKVYTKCGFEEVEKCAWKWDGDGGFFPAMIRWPSGTLAEERRPAMP